MDTDEFTRYMKERVDDQLSYFDSSAIRNQHAYRRLKLAAISCNVLTTMTIAWAFTVPEQYKVCMGILALILSTVVLATYQFEEFQNYGAKWEKFRLVTEQLKSEETLMPQGAPRSMKMGLSLGNRSIVMLPYPLPKQKTYCRPNIVCLYNPFIIRIFFCGIDICIDEG